MLACVYYELPSKSAKTKKRGQKFLFVHPLYVDLPGFEPRLTEPKSVVLPLHHRSLFPDLGLQIYCFFYFFQKYLEKLVLQDSLSDI